MIKQLTTLLATVSIASISLADSIAVRLSPEKEAPQIGSLESLSLAVPAEWPQDVPSVPGWQSVYYRGVFGVYVDNNDISKNLSPKPGASYFLRPDTASQSLAVATKKDTVDIISVDTWFCKVQLETIVLGYIEDATAASASVIEASQADTTQPAAAPEEAPEGMIAEMAGRLAKTGLLGRKRTGTLYKLLSPEGKTLAYVDVSEIPDRIQIEDMLSKRVRVSGFLKQDEETSDVILEAKTLKSVN